MAIEFSRVWLAKFDSLVAIRNFSRGWRFRAIPVDFSDQPCTYTGDVSK